MILHLWNDLIITYLSLLLRFECLHHNTRVRSNIVFILNFNTIFQFTLEERTVCQVHYVAWPDHGVPSVVHPLLDMVRLVRDTQASETLPVLVHCSAGCGRTGTICAIDYVFGLLRTGVSDFTFQKIFFFPI